MLANTHIYRNIEKKSTKPVFDLHTIVVFSLNRTDSNLTNVECTKNAKKTRTEKNPAKDKDTKRKTTKKQTQTATRFY